MAERTGAQRALMAAHACLFGLDLLKMLPESGDAVLPMRLGPEELLVLRGPLASFACRHGAAHVATNGLRREHDIPGAIGRYGYGVIQPDTDSLEMTSRLGYRHLCFHHTNSLYRP